MPTAFVTAPRSDADRIASVVVEERLAACVNRLNCHSTYRWNEEVVSEPEVVLLIKTTEEVYESLIERVLQLHPYNVPCIERFDESSMIDEYANWMQTVVG